MRKLLSYPALGAMLVAGAALGIQLGESAIAEIDPVHFRGPAVHPRERGAAIDPREIEPAAPRYASLYGWEEAAEAVAAGYASAGDAAAQAHDPIAQEMVHAAEAIDTILDEDEEWVEQALAEADRALAEAQRSVDWEEVERYAYYPVSIEETRGRGLSDDDFSAFDDPDPAGGL